MADKMNERRPASAMDRAATGLVPLHGLGEPEGIGERLLATAPKFPVIERMRAYLDDLIARGEFEPDPNPERFAHALDTAVTAADQEGLPTDAVGKAYELLKREYLIPAGSEASRVCTDMIVDYYKKLGVAKRAMQ